MEDNRDSQVASSPYGWVVGIGVGLLVVVSVLGYVVATSLQQLKPAPYAILPPVTGGEKVASVPATSVVPAASEAAIFKPAAASSSAVSAVGPVAVVALPPAGAPLVRTLQDRLSAAGCYDGATNGYWTARTREAMARFVAAVDARRPVREPDPVLLALIETNASVRCGTDQADRPAPAIVTVAASASTDDDEPAAVPSVATSATTDSSDDSEDEAPSGATGTEAGAPSGTVAGAAALAAGAAAAGTSAAAAGSSRKRSATVADDDDDDEDARPARSKRSYPSNTSRSSSGSERSYRPRRQPDVLRGVRTVSRQMTRNMRSVGRSLSRLFR